MISIPESGDPEIYTYADFVLEDFIELKSNDVIEVCMQYPLLGMDMAEKQCFVRKAVYERILEAAKLLPEGYKFKILDAWRSFSLQHELYEKYTVSIVKEFGLENCSYQQRKAVVRKFVSEPNDDVDIPPVHTTGGAVDLTILDSYGRELDMGSFFDEFTDRTYTAYYENEKNVLVKNNRRLLYNIMTTVGFTNLPSEWWHYDYGDRFWAFYKKEPALYRGVFTKEELMNGKT